MRCLRRMLPFIHAFLQDVRERRTTGEGVGVQPELQLQMHARMKLFFPCPTDTSMWAVCKMSGVQQHTPEVSLPRPDRLSVRCVPAQPVATRLGGDQAQDIY